MNLKLGRKPPRPTDQHLKLRSFLDPTKLPAPPPKIDWGVFVNDWAMLKNDQLGDCVPAGILHCAQLATAITATEFHPTDEEAIALYQAVGGYVPGNEATDQGCVMHDVMQYLVDTGFGGQKLDAFAELDVSRFATQMNLLQEIKLANHLFGPLPIGINLPRSAMDQFEAGQPWDVTLEQSPILGGHCVVIVGYDENYFRVVTWGQVVKVTPAFLQRCLEEAYVLLSKLWFPAGEAPNALHYDELLAAFKALPRQS